MKKVITICLAAMVIFVINDSSAIGGLMNPQRIIDIDFTDSAADHGCGIDIPGGAAEPPSDLLTYITYSASFWEYSGPDDPVLKDSDRWVYGDRGGGSQNFCYVSGEGLVADDPVGGYLRANAYVLVKIDNWDNPNLYKDFYVEWTAVSEHPSVSPGVYTYFWGYDSANNNIFPGATLLDSGGDRWTDGWELWRFEPNPALEVWGANFQFSDGTVTLKSLHIETSCVPVPGAVLLGMLGFGVAGLKLRKYV